MEDIKARSLSDNGTYTRRYLGVGSGDGEWLVVHIGVGRKRSLVLFLEFTPIFVPFISSSNTNKVSAS